MKGTQKLLGHTALKLFNLPLSKSSSECSKAAKYSLESRSRSGVTYKCSEFSSDNSIWACSIILPQKKFLPSPERPIITHVFSTRSIPLIVLPSLKNLCQIVLYRPSKID